MSYRHYVIFFICSCSVNIIRNLFSFYPYAMVDVDDYPYLLLLCMIAKVRNYEKNIIQLRNT